MVVRWFRRNPHASFLSARRGPWTRFRPRLEDLEGRTMPATFTVTSNTDAGAGSLRQAILDANNTSGSSTIHFNVGSGGFETISVTSSLPAIIHPVVIDGTSQPLYGGTPMITLNGASAGANATGLTLAGGNSTVIALVIQGFNGSGIVLQGSSGNSVVYSFIGTDRFGTSAVPNGIGVNITNSSSSNVIGGTNPSNGNFISGNTQDGIRIAGNSNSVFNNHIGTNLLGTAALPNGNGVTIASGSNNGIGGAGADLGNIIAGNVNAGIAVAGNGNLVQNDIIGTNDSGTVALPNGYGVLIDGGSNNLIGGTASAAGNLISGNSIAGVWIAVGQNRVQANVLGLNASAANPLSNGNGVVIASGSGNTIGGANPGEGNLISANLNAGIAIESNGNAVQGNFIGTDTSGTRPMGNVEGIIVDGSNNLIGGDNISNLISGNQDNGVVITGNGNIVLFNSIGTDAMAYAPVPN